MHRDETAGVTKGLQYALRATLWGQENENEGHFKEETLYDWSDGALEDETGGPG